MPTRSRLTPILLAALLLALLLGGCATPQLAPSPSLSHPDAPRTLIRLLSFERGDARHPPERLIAVIRLAPEGLRVAVTSPSGQRLMTLIHDDQGARFEDTLAPPPFPAAWLAQRLEWGLWPSEALTRGFEGSRWRLVETGRAHHGGRRDIYHGSRLIARVDYGFAGTRGDDDHVRLDDREAGYVLNISPLDAAGAKEKTDDPIE
ncbi:DUF3261 domain-containing protein [Halotalea alkalilenta]|uniref:DUF3261 domain-containing protein n=1 Tax=Halotalea alkalilenta TaxID=376489 RepID=A0A172YCX2_9GAMM|nr:DUF3261 domain-containing protein [Halotalea alkalilenta]ANF57054.1 hypothetical protein A5892_05885 [Halotalea alkalilenta]